MVASTYTSRFICIKQLYLTVPELDYNILSSDRTTSSSMLHAFKIKQCFQDETAHSQIVLAVQEQSYPNANTQASPEAPKEASRGIDPYYQHAKSAPGIKETILEPLSLSHDHDSIVSDGQICGPCESLQSICCDVGAVICVFPDAVQDLILTIITNLEIEQAEAASIGAKLGAEGYYAINSAVDEKALRMLYNSTLWACGVLTSNRPASIKLFVRGIESSLETFVQRLKRFGGPGSKAQLELENCGPLWRICQLDSLGNVPVQKNGLIAEQEAMAVFNRAKSNTLPGTIPTRPRYHYSSYSEDLTPRGASESVPRYVPK